METIVKMENIVKKYEDKLIFDHYNLTINAGEYVVIIGKSGSGKSTLLNLIGLLDRPNSGKITLFGQSNIKPFSFKAETLLKNKIGYLFQNFALIDDETVYENLLLALDKQDHKQAQKLIKEALDKVLLSGYEKKLVYKCSGGEQQRIAIARLLLKKCDLVLADEPSGSLDHENKLIVAKLLKELNEQGKTVIIVTHDDYFKQFASQLIELK